MRVLVTGSSSCLARALLPKLCGLPQVEHVFGIDLKRAAIVNPKFGSVIGDVRNHDLEATMKGFDALIHLAFAVLREARTDEEMYDNNVNGTMRVFAAAKQAGIRKIINISSVSVYGAGEDVDESAPLAPSAKFPYAGYKAEIERRTQDAFPEVVHLRSHLIFGKNAQPFLRAMCNSRVFISLPKPAARLQVIHEEDVAQAILHALERPAVGAFNIAASDVVTMPDLVKNGRKAMVPAPLKAVRAAAALATKWGSQQEFTWLDIMDTTLTVSCRRARDVLNWTPKFSAWEARQAMIPD